MSAEIELPFANNLSSITTEILAGVNALEIQHDVARMTAHITRVKNFGEERRPEDMVEKILSGSGSYNARQAEVVAVALAESTIFSDWSDTQRRYLLDSALDADILYARKERAYYKTTGKYFGLDKQSKDAITAFSDHIKQRKNLQARLNARVTPSSPAARR